MSEELKPEVLETVNETLDVAQEESKETVEETVEEVVEEAKEAVEEAAEAAPEAVEEVKEAVEEVKEEAKEVVEEAKVYSRVYIHSSDGSSPALPKTHLSSQSAAHSVRWLCVSQPTCRSMTLSEHSSYLCFAHQ